ncbi:MAG: CoA transferase [Chloroflexi bacterium]|nr:CoA transferase [Chloroflexota bacterium]
MANDGSQPAAVSLPLNHVRVLDLSRLLPGPYCSRILADFGAEVIKIELPDGSDWVRHVPPLVNGEGALFQALNQGKKSLTLNLKSDEGRAVLLRLVETADVLLESFRPGVMERLGVGYERLSKANARLIYCSLSGYGQDGPYRERPGHDLNFIGLTGLLDLTGSRKGPPTIPGVPIADLNGALWAAFGILLALMTREQTGQGQRVDGSLLGGALACMSMAVVHSLGGQPVERGGSTLTGGLVCYNVYETKDGKYVTLGALEAQFWTAFCQAAGRDDLVSQQLAPAIPGEPAYDELCALFRTRTRQEWVEAMAGVDTCFEPVYDVEEALASAPVQALEMASGYGLLPPVRLSAQPIRPVECTAARAPALGEHTVTLLAELGYDAAAIENLREQGVI